MDVGPDKGKVLPRSRSEAGASLSKRRKKIRKKWEKKKIGEI